MLSEVSLLTQTLQLLLGRSTLLGNQWMSPLLDIGEQNIGQSVQVCDAQVGESLGRRVDFSVDQVSLHSVWVGLLPVQELLESSHAFGQRQRNLVVGKVVGERTHSRCVLRDTVDHSSDFQEAQLFWSVQLISSAHGGVVVSNLLQCSGDIEHVHGIDFFGVFVRRPHLQLGSQVVQQVVFTAKHGRRSDNGGVGQNVTHNSLRNALCSVVDGRRRRVSVVGRHINISWVSRFLDGLGDSFGDSNVHVGNGKVLGPVVGTNTVENNVRVSHGLGNGVQVSGVKLNKVHHTQIAADFQKTLFHVVSERNHDVGAVLGQLRVQVAAQKARGSENSGSVACSGRTASWPHRNIDFSVSGDVDIRAQKRSVDGSRSGHRGPHRSSQHGGG
ncbi:hypothetical protein CLUG_01992 [Clavispora lusitaniae ATCC 42720]|uniref:Uncharacterized protein n=1 Tax=Clavispora lusitaniae (strain ATCC 42720) TaxID=306902 RepID=C4Y1B0_CLAL4|nr:uncharacterized protein CLUG_01992 [Clavispora lusitaniae ATCC 42720]EEQ37870.1 hypothetical protein CLUG_01992 [Clavispora lusitaniae ATCC 42720]